MSGIQFKVISNIVYIRLLYTIHLYKQKILPGNNLNMITFIKYVNNGSENKKISLIFEVIFTNYI